eukprot:jgi/Mesen1/9731/ME000695S09060
MGLIEDGRVVCELPSCNAVAIEYPGRIVSADKALETLGGEQAISKAIAGEGAYLQLRFRPDDPYSHPAFGDGQATCGLLFRITRKRKRARAGAGQEEGEGEWEGEGAGREHAKGVQGQKRKRRGWESRARSEGILQQQQEQREEEEREDKEEEEEEEVGGWVVSADVVARVDKVFTFDGMADFQYLAGVHRHQQQQKRAAERSHKGLAPRQPPGVTARHVVESVSHSHLCNLACWLQSIDTRVDRPKGGGGQAGANAAASAAAPPEGRARAGAGGSYLINCGVDFDAPADKGLPLEDSEGGGSGNDHADGGSASAAEHGMWRRVRALFEARP